MARELPLNNDGSIRFPGSDRVWTVANGSSDNTSDIEKLARRVQRANSPDEEDQILLSMLDKKNDIGGREVSQIENFLAAARLDAHRKQSMDELMALTLSQMYAKYHSVFPYFAALPSLSADQVIAFAKAAERIEKFENVELNAALGEFHALIKLIILLKDSGKLPEPKAADLFSSVSNKFAAAERYGSVSTAVFDAIEKILQEAGKNTAENTDTFLAGALAGESATKEFRLGEKVYSADFSQKKTQQMREVLRLQSVTSLHTLLETYRAAQIIVRAPDAAAFRQIETNATRLVEISEAPEDKLSGKLRETLIVARPAKVMEIVARMKKEFAKKTLSKNISKLASELIEELSPFRKTALVAWIYAYYFSPDDLAVARDRYLVRRHMFSESQDDWPETRVAPSAGSYIVGGFAQMSTGVANIAKTKIDADNSLKDGPQQMVAVAQLAAVRNVPWQRVDERSLHLIALKLRLGREFIVRSALQSDMRVAVAQATIGFIGQRRRFELLQSLTRSDVASALDLLSAADLMFIADALIERTDVKLSGPVLTSFRKEASITSSDQSHYFGGVHPTTYGCAEPHLMQLVPYEEYENLFSPQPLAERLSDILLYLAEAADRAGLPVEGLAVLAEPAVQQFSTRAKMNYLSDWKSAVNGMRSLDINSLMHLLDEN